MMVECYTPINKIMQYYGNSSFPAAHFPFNFLLIKQFNEQSDAYDINNMVKSWIQNMPQGMWPNWVVSIELQYLKKDNKQQIIIY